MVVPVIERLVSALRDLGHEPVGVVTPRVERRNSGDALVDANVPAGLDLLYGKDRWSIEPLLRALDPDLTVCWGFPWKLPHAALDVALVGHPAGGRRQPLHPEAQHSVHAAAHADAALAGNIGPHALMGAGHMQKSRR